MESKVTKIQDYKFCKQGKISMVDFAQSIFNDSRKLNQQPIQEDKDHSFPSFVEGTIGGLKDE